MTTRASSRPDILYYFTTFNFLWSCPQDYPIWWDLQENCFSHPATEIRMDKEKLFESLRLQDPRMLMDGWVMIKRRNPRLQNKYCDWFHRTGDTDRHKFFSGSESEVQQPNRNQTEAGVSGEFTNLLGFSGSSPGSISERITTFGVYYRNEKVNVLISCDANVKHSS